MSAQRPLPRPGAALLAGAVLASAAALSAQISLRRLVDVDTTPIGRSSDPVFGAELPDGTCIFAATDHAHGREVWVIRNGAAPALLKDILPGQTGSHPRDFVPFQGEVWFSASDGQNGRELWKTDGTPAGTVLVVDLAVGSAGSAPSGLAVQGNRLYFSAFDGAGGREPHVSDGTPAGTRLLKDVRAGAAGSGVSNDAPHTFVPSDVGNTVFFAADDGVSGIELWQTDGTTAGTMLVDDLNPGLAEGFDPDEAAVVLNGTLFFRGDDGGGTGSELYKSDGSAAGTVRVKDLRAGTGSGFPNSLTVHQGKVYFSAIDTNLGRELFETDGTLAGTRVVADIRPGSSSSNPSELASCGNLLYFSASADQVFTEPHISDGTPQGTRVLADVNPGVFSSLPADFTCCGNLVFFTARTQAEGEELFVTDGRIGNVTLLQDFLPGTDFGDPEHLFCCGSHLLGAASTPAGNELFQSDGTVAGTQVVDLDPTQTTASSNPRQFRGVDMESFYFVGDTTLHGSEVFFFDGTRSRALEVNVGRDDSSPENLTVVGRSAYWTARTSAEGRELYRSIDGGPAELVADLRVGALSSSPAELVAFDHRTLVCRARTPNQGTEIVVARNDQPGVQIFDVRPGAASSSPGDLTRLVEPDTGDNFVVFVATDDAVGTELFAFDGVGIRVVADLAPGTAGSGARKLVGNADHSAILFEAEHNGSNHLQRLTVRNSPTGLNLEFLIEQIFDLGRSFLIESIADPDEALRRLGVRAWVLMADVAANQTGLEPYFIDDQGTEHLIEDVMPGPAGSDPAILATDADGISYTAFDAQLEREFRSFDVQQGTVTEIDLLPGAESSDPEPGVAVGDGTLFNARLIVDEEQAAIFLARQQVILTLGLDPKGLEDGVDLGPIIVASALDRNVGGGREPVGIALDGVARATEFGVSCDGRARTTATTPRIGRTARWKTSGGQPGDFGFQVVGAPVGPRQQLAGCDLYIDPATMITAFAGTAPSFESSVVLSNDTSLVGVAVVTQGVWIPTDGRAPVLSNGVYQGIGN